MDVYVVIEPTGDPSYKKGFEDKLKARSEGRQPITDTIYGHPGKRWVYMGWATEGMAKTYGVPLSVLEKLVIGGCMIDYGELRSECEHVMSVLADAKQVHVTDPHGTDFRLDIEGRTAARGRRHVVPGKGGDRRLGREPAGGRGVRRAGGDGR